MKKIQDAGFRIVEVPVHHYHRAYGKSQFFNFRRAVQDRRRRDALWVRARRSAGSICAPAYGRSRARVADPTTRRVPDRRTRSVTADYREFYRGRRVMITGGLGFIGSNLARQLVELGADVAARRFADPRLRRQPVQHRRHRGSRARQHRRRPPAEHDELPRARTARSSSTSPARSATSTACAIPYTDLEINCRSQLTLLEACRHHNPDVKVVFAGTRQVYGRPDSLPVDETHLVRPTDVNGDQQGGRRVLPPGLQQRVRRARLLAAPHERLRPAPADQAQPPGLHRLVHPPGDRGPRDPDLRRRLAAARLRLRRRRGRRVPARGRAATRATARCSTSAATSRSAHRDLVELLIDARRRAAAIAVRRVAAREEGDRHRQLLRRLDEVQDDDRLAPAVALARRPAAHDRRSTAQHLDHYVDRGSAPRSGCDAAADPVPVARAAARTPPDVRAAIDRVVARGWFVLGPEVEAFEHEFAAALGRGARGRRRHRHRRASR